MFFIPIILMALVLATITHAIVRAIRPDGSASLVRYYTVAMGFVLAYAVFWAYFLEPARMVTIRQ